MTTMPQVTVSQADLAQFGETWQRNGGSLSRTPPQSSGQLGNMFDEAVGKSLAAMLGGIPVVKPTATSLTAAMTDCVEVGPVRVIGGVRPQNFDVGYRPDGVRFAFDSKTLNDAASVKKNWQNMVNDLATEATTVHSRFPHAVVAFMVIIPTPCLVEPQRSAMIETLERLARRVNVEDSDYMAEAISLILWNPGDGSLNQEFPPPASPLRIERLSDFVETAYISRYKGLPPHAVAE
ncbi:MAG: hypothetical protein KA368_15445 [Acidobacteria bacterium]|nr:hypothetical protein [Acidobacteriota bacterium]